MSRGNNKFTVETMIMRPCNTLVLFGLLIISTLAACGEHDPEKTEVFAIEIKELSNYDRLTSENDLLLGVPVRLKTDHDTQHIFAQDMAHWTVIEMDEQSNEIRRYGSRGRGPGELQGLDDFFISAEHLFIVDGSRFLIHKYSRNDGQFISSLNYRELLVEGNKGSEQGIPQTPPAPLTSNNNRPFVTYNEVVLLPAHTGGEYLYRAVTWEGEKVAHIGEIPDGYIEFIDDEQIRQSLKNNRVPAHELALAFPVNDLTNPNEIFVVYSAISKIAKYTFEGEKIWEQTIPLTPEVDSLMIDLDNALLNRPNQRVSLLPVKKYMAGRSSPNGDVYLFTYTNMDTPHTPRRPMWVHQFDSEGTLMYRYKINSDTDLFYYPGIDFKNRRLYTPAFNESDIRIYPF